MLIHAERTYLPFQKCCCTKDGILLPETENIWSVLEKFRPVVVFSEIFCLFRTTMFIWKAFSGVLMDFQPILAAIKPSRKEEHQLSSVVNEVIRKIRIPHAKALLGGSGAKQTWLKNTHDVDIYVTFDLHVYKEKSDQLADLLAGALKKRFPKMQRLHGSRDYFQILHKGYTFELVPILHIRTPYQAQNTTDFSQLHVQYVLQHVKKKRSLADEIRLTKQFAKANHVYGAESYIQGFSGYVLELLTIHHGSFLKLVCAATRWRKGMVIGSRAQAKKLNPSKLSPLIVMDPVQPDRNAAAALSEEKFYDFIMTTRTFLKHPSLSFFQEKPLDVHQLRKLGTLIQVNVTTLPGNRDIAGTKAYKAFTFLREQIRYHDFSLVAAKWDINHEKRRAVFLYVVNNPHLPPTKKQPGPPVDNVKALAAFKHRHAHVETKGNRAYATEKRLYPSLNALMRDLLKTENVKSRVRSIQLVAEPR